jgi:DNA repair exonuclease SbcCD ATPase subunit|tara:strand:+ start:2182 stop:3783 length:1602 start_codon:yes stop_codon:yes gene_type:complete
MQIQKISARNFYSFKSLDLDFTSLNGIVRILGKNKDSLGSNGAGKSVLFEAVTWGLFGTTIRKSTDTALINTQAGSDCSVSILLEKEGVGTILITRAKKPSSLSVSINEKELSGERASEIQARLEELLETDYKSFLASVVFGQHASFTFLDSTPEDKRKIIKNCFNLDDIFSKRSSVKNLKSSYQGEMKVMDALISSLLEEHDALQSEVPDAKYKLVELPNLEDILDSESKIVANDRITRDLQRISKKERDRLRRVNDSVKEGVYKTDKDCPVCKSSFTKSQSLDDIHSFTKEARLLSDQISSREKEIQNIKEANNSLIPLISSSEWAEYNKKNKQIENSQGSLHRLSQVTTQLEDYQKKKVDLDSLLEVMKFWELAFSEKGLIRYVIRNILEYFNLKSNEYVSILTGNQFSLKFNDELSEEISNNGTLTKYISLSGGEKRKVNLAIMLALQDLSSKISRTDCNLLFFDEVCDNLDDPGILAVNNLLHTLNSHSPDKKVLVITHNGLLQDLLGDSQSITVTKSKGISSINNGN